MSNTGSLGIKYDVREVGTDELVHNCFVLRPDCDKAARVALAVYAGMTNNRQLGLDIMEYLWDKQWLKNPPLDDSK